MPTRVAAAFHEQVVSLARTEYLALGGAPVDVLAYFSTRPKPPKAALASALAEFVGHDTSLVPIPTLTAAASG